MVNLFWKPDACPVEIIKYELVTDGAEVTAVAPAEVAVEVSPAAEAVAVAGAASAELMSLMEGDRSLAILFGSQTGNAAGLAEDSKTCSQLWFDSNSIRYGWF